MQITNTKLKIAFYQCIKQIKLFNLIIIDKSKTQ